MILEWVQIAVEEERVSVLPCACLEREGDEIAESSRRHSVLRWEEAVVGGEADFRTPVYCFGENDETELAGEPSRQGLLEEQPRVTARTGSLSFKADRDVQLLARLDEGDRVGGPVFAVEVDR